MKRGDGDPGCGEPEVGVGGQVPDHGDGGVCGQWVRSFGFPGPLGPDWIGGEQGILCWFLPEFFPATLGFAVVGHPGDVSGDGWR